jgi:hypothetical protein
VSDALREDGVFQGVGDQTLAHDVLKDLGAILAGYDLVGHGGNFGFWILDFGLEHDG